MYQNETFLFKVFQMYTLKFTIKDLPLTRNKLADRRWARKKEADKWHELVRHHAQLQRPQAPLKKATLHLVRHSSRCCDYDGLVSSFKYVVDGLVKVGIIIDDNMKVIDKPLYEWEKAARNEGYITVEVREL